MTKRGLPAQAGNTPLITVAAVVFVAIVVTGLYFLNSSSQPESQLPTSVNKMADDSMRSSDMPQTNRYVEYSPSVLADSADTKRVLFFYANWCPICRPADAEFQKRLSEIPDDVTLIRVNYNDSDTDANEQALADKYGITYQHTFVLLDKDGNAVKKWNGGAVDQLLTEVE